MNDPESWNRPTESYETVRKQGILGTPLRKGAAFLAASLLLLGGDAETSYFERQPLTKHTDGADTLRVFRSHYDPVGFFDHVSLENVYETYFECDGHAISGESRGNYAFPVAVPPNDSAFFGMNDFDENGYLIDRDYIWIRSLKGGKYAVTATGSAFSPPMDSYTYFDFSGDAESLTTLGRQVVAYWALTPTADGLEPMAVCAA